MKEVKLWHQKVLVLKRYNIIDLTGSIFTFVFIINYNYGFK